MDGEAEMSFRQYGAVLRRRKWWIVGATSLTVISGLCLVLLTTPIYAASSKILVQPRGQDTLFGEQVLVLNERAVQTEVEVLEGAAVRNRVMDDVGLRVVPPRASAGARGQTDVVTITVRDTSAANAQLLANAYAVAYIDLRREQSVADLLAASAEVQMAVDGLQSQLDELSDTDPLRPSLVAQIANFSETLDRLRVDAALRTGGATIIEPASLPVDPVEPTPVRTLAIAVLVGVLVGTCMAFIVEHLDDKVRTDDDLLRIGASPVLAVVPIESKSAGRPVAATSSDSVTAEAYRGLRTNLRFLALDRPTPVVQVTSSNAGEGKTTTATNLAVVLVQAGHRVVLVDADLRRPRVHEAFDVAQSPGLIDLLLGDDGDQAIHEVEIAPGERLSVITSGAVPSNPGEALSSKRLDTLMKELASSFDFVLVDSPPVLPVADAIALSSAVDAVVVVAQAGRVTTHHVQATADRLAQVGAPVVGYVLNQVTARGIGYSSYGGYGPRESRAGTGS